MWSNGKWSYVLRVALHWTDSANALQDSERPESDPIVTVVNQSSRWQNVSVKKSQSEKSEGPRQEGECPQWESSEEAVPQGSLHDSQRGAEAALCEDVEAVWGDSPLPWPPQRASGGRRVLLSALSPPGGPILHRQDDIHQVTPEFELHCQYPLTRYLLGEDFMGCRIGPEPTTDKWVINLFPFTLCFSLNSA